MTEKKPPSKYREGAKGRCFWCGRPEAEHKSGERECPGLAEHNDVTGRTVRKRGRTMNARGAQGVGLIR